MFTTFEKKIFFTLLIVIFIFPPWQAKCSVESVPISNEGFSNTGSICSGYNGLPYILGWSFILDPIPIPPAQLKFHRERNKGYLPEGEFYSGLSFFFLFFEILILIVLVVFLSYFFQFYFWLRSKFVTE